ncbi:hypothetical protein HDU77_011791 [Chytriomyces hyalinus]|nr:hypothetical protein HDU77_011791 [Chytriomyces hyalinus]
MNRILLTVTAVASAVSAATYAVTLNQGPPKAFVNTPAGLTVGDSIIFDLDGTVALVDVDEATFNSCAGVTDTMAPAKGLTSNGPAAAGFSYTFSQAGTFYIISTNGSDCLSGLKFAVAVADAAPTTTASVPAANESPSASTDAIVSSVEVTSTAPAPAATVSTASTSSGLLIPSLSIRPSPIVNGVAATTAVQPSSKSGAVSKIMASQFLVLAFFALI